LIVFTRCPRPGSRPHGEGTQQGHGLATYRVVRYADDFVVMVCGGRQHTEAIREHIISGLCPARLPQEKTTNAHLDEGFEFLGFRIQRQTKRGSHCRYVYTWVAKRSLTPNFKDVQALGPDEHRGHHGSASCKPAEPSPVRSIPRPSAGGADILHR
jgi:RNA-directed DNA polymerase